MTQLLINIGESVNDKRGDPLRTAFDKVNLNFTELYTRAVNTDAQTLTLNGNALSISGGNSVTLPTVTSLINGSHAVSLNSTGDVTFPDNLTVSNSIIGKSSTETITEEVPGGTASSTTTIESQIEIATTGIVIAKRIIQTTDDTVTTTTDETGSTLEVNNIGAFIKKYVEPDGPNNGAYFQVSTTNNGAILEGVDKNLNSTDYGRVLAVQNAVSIGTSVDGVNKYWLFDYLGGLTLPTPTSQVFTLTFDASHYTPSIGKPSLTLTDTPWQIEGQVMYEQNGNAVLQLTNIWPILINPGYDSGDTFTFSTLVHGLSDYTLTIVLNDVVLPGGAGWTANLAASQLPAYPSSILANGAIKLTADEASLTFGADGSLTLPPTGTLLAGTINFNGTLQIGNQSQTQYQFEAIVDEGGPNPVYYSKLSLPNIAEIFAGEDLSLATWGSEFAVKVRNPSDFSDNTWSFGNDGSLTFPDGVFIIDSFQASTQIATWTAGVTNMSPTNSISFFGHSSTSFDTTWTISGSGITGQSAITAINPIMSGMSITGYTVIIAQTISTGLVTGDYVFSNPPITQGVNLSSDLSTWTFGTNGQLTVPGAIRKDGGLYMNSSGTGVSSTVLVNGEAGSVILRTDDGTSNKSLVFDVTGKTSFPSSLEFSDGSTYNNSTLTGAVDSDLVLEVKHRPTVTAVATPNSSPSTIVVDISENDDVTVVVANTWEVNLNPSGAPYWKTIGAAARDIPNNTYVILLTNLSEEDYNYPVTDGTTYTFRQIASDSLAWTIRSQTGGLVGPGGVIVTNETAPLGEGTYRELAIELPTPDGLNEQRWVFANDGDFTAPGDIFAGSFLGQSLEITGAGVVASTYAGDLQTLHVAGAVGNGLTLGVDGGLTSWLFKPNGTLTLPQYHWIESVGSNATISLNGVGSNESIIELGTRVDGETITSTFAMHPAYGIDLTSVRDVTITAGYDEATAKRDAWQTAEQDWTDIRDQDATTIAPNTRPWAGMPSYEAYTEIMLYTAPPGVLPQPDSLVVKASIAKAAYELWQAEQAAIKVTITAKDNTWTFGNDGSLSFPDSTDYTGKDITVPLDDSLTVNMSFDTGSFNTNTTFKVNPGSIKLPTGNGYIYSGGDTAASQWGLDSANKTLFFPDAGDGVYPQIRYSTAGDDGMQLFTAAKPIKITTASNTNWSFGTTGDITLPAGGDVVDSTGVGQLANRTEGTFPLQPGSTTTTFNFDVNATYTMWLRATVNNGVIAYNATFTISNANLPVLGQQQAYAYSGAGTILDWTSLPSQLVGTAGAVTRSATLLGTPATAFTFVIQNDSGSIVDLHYGWTKI